MIRAKQEARSKNPEDMTASEKKEERRIANRLSAFQSRQRRKAIIEDLHKTVAKISKDNAEQRKQTLELTTKLDAARSENSLLRQQLAMLSAGFAATTAQSGSDGSSNNSTTPAGGAEIMNFLNQLATMGQQQQSKDGAPAPAPFSLDQVLQGIQQQAAAAAAAASTPAEGDTKEEEK